MAEFSPDSIANYFIDIAASKGEQLSPMKLQKMMYFAHGFYLGLMGDDHALVDDDLQAWDYGPVFPSIYHEFKDFGNRAITRKAVSVDMDGTNVRLTEPTIIQEAEINSDLDASFASEVMDFTWQKYCGVPTIQLSELTHEKGSPWSTVRTEAEKKFHGRIPRGLNIPNPLIQQWFQRNELSNLPVTN